MRTYETVKVYLPIDITEEEIKNMAIDYKKYLIENNSNDNIDNFNKYYYDDTSNEYFYNFLFDNNLSNFEIIDYDTEKIYNEIKKYL